MSRTEWAAELALPVTEGRDHIQGHADAAVTLVEYGDYQCPYCGAAYPIVKEVQRRLGSKLRFVFRNFPLRNSHPHAQHAAEAVAHCRDVVAPDFGKPAEMAERRAEIGEPRVVGDLAVLGHVAEGFL